MEELTAILERKLRETLEKESESFDIKTAKDAVALLRELRAWDEPERAEPEEEKQGGVVVLG